MNGDGPKVIGEVLERERGDLLSSLQEALKDSYAIVDRIKRETIIELEEIEREYSTKAESAYATITGSAELEAKSNYLKLFERESERIMHDALMRIAEMPRDSRYEMILGKILEEAIEVVDADYVVVTPAKGDAGLVRRLARRMSRRKGTRTKIRVSDDVVDSVGGVVVRNEEGTVSYDNTFEARLSRVADGLKRIMFDRVMEVR